MCVALLYYVALYESGVQALGSSEQLNTFIDANPWHVSLTCHYNKILFDTCLFVLV